MNRFYPFVAVRARGRCEYCRASEEVTNGVFAVDHIHSESLGGANEYDNFALASFTYNGYKSDFVTGIDPETDTEARLFHPRRDTWNEHFAVDDTNHVAGLTDVGRATIARLNLNHDRQIKARAFWRGSGIFP